MLLRIALLVSVCVSPSFAGEMGFGTPVVETLLSNGRTREKVDLVFLGEGYRREELVKYAQDVNVILDRLFAVEPYKSMKSKFNAYKVNVVSKESGSDYSWLGTKADTAFDSRHWGRGVNMWNWWNVTLARRKAPASDIVIIVVNSPYYGGDGAPGYTSVSGGRDGLGRLAVHEMGHSFGNLGDEYDQGEDVPESYTVVYEYLVPNITTDPDPSRLKWRKYLGREGVGIVRGEGGLYRPTVNGCLMREDTLMNFCLVCREAIREKIEWLTGPVGGWVSEILDDPFVINAPDYATHAAKVAAKKAAAKAREAAVSATQRVLSWFW